MKSLPPFRGVFVDLKTIHTYIGNYLHYSVCGTPKGVTNVIREPETGIDILTLRFNKTFLVIVRASNEDRDWVTNFDVFGIIRKAKKVYPYGDPRKTKVRFHKGYINGYLAIREKVLEAFKQSGCCEACVIGYSMGGGIAPIITLDLQFNFDLKEDEIGCGFSGPRTMNRFGVNSFNKRVPLSIRYKYGNDLVTKLPPPILGFRHAGIIYFHTGPKEYWWKISLIDHAGYSKIQELAKSYS